MVKKIYAITSLILLMSYFGVVVDAQDNKTEFIQQVAKFTCSDCHLCDNPTLENPCLRICPRQWMKIKPGKPLSVKQAPETILINALENKYEPVQFSHKSHAEMAEMTEGCVTCHHYTPTDAAPPTCKTCHSQTITESGLDKPGLRAVYHQQCLQCHREWSGQNACESCHALKGSPDPEAKKIAALFHPCKTPAKKVYQVDLEDGPYVTFFHDFHANLYGVSCEKCHGKESCAGCHYKGEVPAAIAAAREGHEKCSACHDVEDDEKCTKCHAKTERKGFDHKKSAGWDLQVYHQELSCNSCHPAGKKIGKLARNCNKCHSQWNVENFDHSIVGLALDENHAEIECQECHQNRSFEKKPVCKSCHEEESYPKDKPGKVTQKGR